MGIDFKVLNKGNCKKNKIYSNSIYGLNIYFKGA